MPPARDEEIPAVKRRLPGLPPFSPSALFFAAVLLLLAVWLAAHFSWSLTSSHAWLMLAAERLLRGERMEETYFETNPPLSVLCYVPPVLMARWLGVPAYLAPYIWGTLLLLLSAFALRRQLARWPGLDAGARTVFLFAYLIANTILTASSAFFFAERDQLVILALYPFLLEQAAITRGAPRPLPPRAACLLLLPCAVGILIKPQFGIFPALLFAHRAFVRKSVSSVLRDRDFLILAAAALAYAGAIFAFFPGYVSVIFPDFLRFYLTAANPLTPEIFLVYAALVACAAALGPACGLSARQMKLPGLALAAAFLSLLLVLLQWKGIYYHLIPALVFCFTGAGLMLLEILRRWLPARKGAAPALAVALLLALAFALGAQRERALTHEGYLRTPLARALSACGAGCRYFVFTEGLDMFQQEGLYTGTVYASRFPALWWLPGLLEEEAARPGAAGQKDLKETEARHIGYVAADFMRYRPALVFIAVNLTVGGHKDFDLIGYLSRDARFRAAFAPYRKAGRLADNRKNYIRNAAPANDVPLIYDIYRRE
jgi:hypothetical protein